MNLIQETNFIMKKYNITANKNFGQNFLINETVIEKIISQANISNNDLIIEIGPGLGTLTKYLLEKAGKVIAIELDKNMLNILHDRFSLYNNFELINDDILKVDLNTIIANNSTFKFCKVVANLPYYITTPIIMKLLEEKLNINSIIVMVQKEVAERLTESPGGKNTGSITYTINYYTEPEIILSVPNSSFIPAPKVDSAVIKLNILKNPKIYVLDEPTFFKVIKASFLQKRKTLVNAITNSHICTKIEIEQILETLNIDLMIRAEKLSLEEFGLISDNIYKLNKK